MSVKEKAAVDKFIYYGMRKLHGKYKLGIVSNFAIPECVLRLLKRDGLAGFFAVGLIFFLSNKYRNPPQGDT